MAEIAAASGETPLIALGLGFAGSIPCYTVVYRGRVAAMFGVVPQTFDFPRIGSVWMLGSDDIPLFKQRFVRYSREWLEKVTEDYDLVGNWVDNRNLAHIKWLSRMGFAFVRTDPQFGALKLPFHEFTKIV